MQPKPQLQKMQRLYNSKKKKKGGKLGISTMIPLNQKLALEREALLRASMSAVLRWIFTRTFFSKIVRNLEKQHLLCAIRKWKRTRDEVFSDT
jgi:hypothetical protein